MYVTIKFRVVAIGSDKKAIAESIAEHLAGQAIFSTDENSWKINQPGKVLSIDV